MLSQNYGVAAQSAKTEMNHGADLYRSSFSEPQDSGYVWAERARSLRDILREETMPLVVKLCSENSVKETEAPVNLQRPLLLYREVTEKKLHARNLRLRTAARDDRLIYQTVGPYVNIPEQFPGYFQLLEGKDSPIQVAGDVASLIPTTFVSTLPCDGYVCVSHLEETLYKKSSLSAGLYHATKVMDDSITYVSRRKSEKKKKLRYLRCESEQGKVVLFPAETKGSYYICNSGSPWSKTVDVLDSNRLYRWTDLDPAGVKDLRVRLVHGQAPRQECQFTGLLELCQVSQDHNVIGCTVTSSPRLFEMAVTSEPYFLVALNSDNQDAGSLQQKCLKFSRNELSEYLQAIKVRKDYDIDEVDVGKG